MRKMITLLWLAALGLGLTAPIALADHHESKGMESSSMSAAMIDEINAAKSKILELAEATPANKYSWAPAEGVRSFAETFLHVATSNYRIPSMMDVPVPDGIDVMTLEKSTTDKDVIIKHLTASFAHVIAALEALPAAKMEDEVTLFGGFDTNRLRGYMIVVTHEHEHLGQLIAYARSNGIVPPWSARQAAAQAEAKKKAAEKADE